MEEVDRALEAVIDGLVAAGEDSLADTIEEEEEEIEAQLDSGSPTWQSWPRRRGTSCSFWIRWSKLDVLADKAQDRLTLLDQAASKHQITP